MWHKILFAFTFMTLAHWIESLPDEPCCKAVGVARQNELFLALEVLPTARNVAPTRMA